MKIKVSIVTVLCVVSIIIGYFLNYILSAKDQYLTSDEYIIWHKTTEKSSTKFFEYPQVFGLSDKSIETKANDNLGWIYKNTEPDFLYDSCMPQPPKVIFKSNEYLSIRICI